MLPISRSPEQRNMRGLGNVLMGIGAGLGIAVGVGMAAGVGFPGLSWLLVVGLVKLTLLGAVGMIASGAVLRRLANRAEERERLLLSSSIDRETGY